jgi:hypothetical protein
MNGAAALRWAVLTAALAGAVGISAYWSALASRPVGVEQSPPPARPAPGLLPLEAGRPGRGVSQATRDRAYVRGRREGFREGQRATRRKLRARGAVGFAGWTPGAAYIVIGAQDGRGIRGRVGPLVPSATYRLCRDGKRICVRPRD